MARGGPVDRPYKILRSGLVFRVLGRAGRRQTTIQILRQGQHKSILSLERDNLGRQLREGITRILHRNLLRLTPIRTGRLRTSTRIKRNPWRITQGPTPQGKNRGNYGRFANRRSRRNAGFIERSCTQTGRQSQSLIRKFQKLAQNTRNLGEAGASRSIGGALTRRNIAR